MISLLSKQHSLHAPQYEYFRGEPVPCFESPQRAEFVEQVLQTRGHTLRSASADSTPVLPQIHSERYLTFLETAWEQWLALDPNNASVQPFPAVWPVRSLRSDIEPANFTAKLGLYSMANDAPLVAGTWAAAKEAADMAVSAAELVAAGERSVFSASRPPGHHAGADFMGGYCYLNNAALAAQTLRAQGAERVAVLDVDYHHGNGTQSIFYKRSDVVFISIHADPIYEFPFYLGHADEVGEGQGDGFNLNIPLPAGTQAEAWFAALESACDRMQQLKVDALVVSLGLDTFADDPLSQFALRSEHYTHMGERLAQLGWPTVFILEGGYAATELGNNAVNVLEGFEQV